MPDPYSPLVRLAGPVTCEAQAYAGEAASAAAELFEHFGCDGSADLRAVAGQVDDHVRLDRQVGARDHLYDLRAGCIRPDDSPWVALAGRSFAVRCCADGSTEVLDAPDGIDIVVV